MVTETEVDVARCEALATRGASGDVAASRELVELVWPSLVRFVRASRRLGSLAKSEDHVHEVVTNVVEKLGRADGGGLRLYPAWRERNASKTFADWMRIVATNAVRDYVREQSGWQAPAVAGEPSVKRLLNEFATSPALEKLGVRPPMTAAQTARQLLDFGQRRLPEAQYRALTLWIEGGSFAEVASDLGLDDAEAARKLVRAAVAVLRREFGGSGAEP